MPQLMVLFAVLVVGLIRAIASSNAFDARKPMDERVAAHTVARICECLMAIGIVVIAWF